MLAKGLTFQEALKEIGKPLSINESFDKFVTKTYKEDRLDKMPYSIRAKNLFQTLDFLVADRVLYRMEKALEAGRPLEADRILKEAGV